MLLGLLSLTWFLLSDVIVAAVSCTVAAVRQILAPSRKTCPRLRLVSSFVALGNPPLRLS